MGLINKVSEIHALLFLKMIPEMIAEYWKFSKHTVRCGMSKQPNKLLTEILMLTHALEKGFSINEKKKGFGLEKIERLEKYIERYVEKYGYSDLLEVPISIVFRLVEYHNQSNYHHARLDKVFLSIKGLVESLGLYQDFFHQAGYLRKTREEMLPLSKASFEELAKSRYSFRHFDKVPVSNEEIIGAIEIAKKSPSACNRQSYRVHVYRDEKKNELLKLQAGANSFYKEVDKVLLITSDLNRYYTMEQHLPYIDSSLFAMSLMYALTVKHIASIPLTLCRRISVIKAIEVVSGIPEHEIPIVLIAIGHYPDKADVSISSRMQVGEFTTFHE